MFPEDSLATKPISKNPSRIARARNEIQDMISSKLEEWGIEPPEPLLTEEQRDELRTGIEELRESDVTPEEIKEYIAGRLGARNFLSAP